jgi:hypothetical protein
MLTFLAVVKSNQRYVSATYFEVYEVPWVREVFGRGGGGGEKGAVFLKTSRLLYCIQDQDRVN